MNYGVAAVYGVGVDDIDAYDWCQRLAYELKSSCPGLLLHLRTDDRSDGAAGGTLTIGVLRVPGHLRGRGHASRIVRQILAAADARHLAVVATPTAEYGSDRDRLADALSGAGFVFSPDDPTGHTMRREPRAADSR